MYSVERLYCKRPILYLASSKILTPTPSPPGERGEDTLAGWKGGGSMFQCWEDARHCSILYIRKYCVVYSVHICLLRCHLKQTVGSAICILVLERDQMGKIIYSHASIFSIYVSFFFSLLFGWFQLGNGYNM